MGIEWYRDLFICILGIGATLSIIFIAVLAFLVYRKLMPILKSLKATTRTVENLSSCVQEGVAGPLVQIVSFVQGVRQAVGLVNRFTKKKEER